MCDAYAMRGANVRSARIAASEVLNGVRLARAPETCGDAETTNGCASRAGGVTCGKRKARAVRSAQNVTNGVTHLRGPNVLRCAAAIDVVDATPDELDEESARMRALPVRFDTRLSTTAWIPG